MMNLELRMTVIRQSGEDAGGFTLSRTLLICYRNFPLSLFVSGIARYDIMIFVALSYCIGR